MFNFTKSHDCREELREFSLKATPARVAVLSFLEVSKTPVDTNSIIEYLKSKNIDADPATVFRIINAFSQKGVVNQVQFNDSKTRYELSSKGDHHHLICTNCGRIEDIEDVHVKNLEEGIKVKTGFLVKSHSLEFFGICKLCQS